MVGALERGLRTAQEAGAARHLDLHLGRRGDLTICGQGG
jgi:hypothetical protein